MVTKQQVISLTQKLIAIDSQNPGANEARIAGFVAAYLRRLNLKTRIYEFRRGRANVVATLKGKSRAHSLLVTPHLDTVPAGTHWKHHPFKAELHGGRLFGLGATDCKGNLACGMEAIRSIVEEGVKLDYDIVFAATADEESGSRLGLEPLLEKKILSPDAALVLDSDDFSIIVAQKGLLHMKVKLSGKKAHGAYPWLGRNAIDEAVAALGNLKGCLFPQRQKTKGYSRYLKPPTLNIGTIRGGDKVNVVADWCEFEIDCRFLPGMDARALIRRIRRIVRSQARNCTVEIEGIQHPYLIDEKHPLVEDLAASMRYARCRPLISGSEGATTISFFQARGIPAVATGFGHSGCAHIADEFVSAENLYRGTLVLEHFFKHYRPR